MKTEFIRTNGITLHCKVAGNGPLVILLHGFPEFWFSWRRQIPVLSQHYKVVAPDLRGYNLSDKPKGIKNYTLEVLVNDIKGLITALGEKKAIIVGHDWGGAIAWALAGFFPEMVSQLIILNMPHPLELNKHLKKGSLQQWKKSWYMALFQLPMLPEWRIYSKPEAFFYRALKGWACRKEAFSDNDIAQYIEAFKDKASLTAAINYYRAVRYGNKRSDGRTWQKSPMPVLFIFGEKDRALGKELTYNTQNYCSGKLSIKYLKNASHWVQHDEPELVNRYILDFLSDYNIS